MHCSFSPEDKISGVETADHTRMSSGHSIYRVFEMFLFYDSVFHYNHQVLNSETH